MSEHIFGGDESAMADTPQSHPAPTDLLTDEEIVAKEKEWESRFKDYKLEKGVKAEGFYSFIAQAQLSKLQQARPTEQVREKLEARFCEECCASTRLGCGQEKPCYSCRSDVESILSLLPDEQAIRADERKAIGEWLQGDCPHRMIAGDKGEPDISLRKRHECWQCLESLKSGEPQGLRK